MASKNITLVFAWALLFLLALIFINMVTCEEESNNPGEESNDPGEESNDPEEELNEPEEECWKTIDPACPDGSTEIYKEVDENVETSRCCCTTDSKEAQIMMIRAVGCQTTSCLKSNTDRSSFCTSDLKKRWVNGTKMEYEMVTFGICQDENENGVQALCCPLHSQEGMLTALLGAEKHQFPHFAILRVNQSESGTGLCGATIYNERFLVTAAHCVLSDEGVLWSANGSKVELDVQIANRKGHHTYEVEECIPHEEYVKNPEGTLYDIALVKLAKNITFSPDFVMALPIAPKGFDPFKYSDQAVLIGVGDTDTFDSANMLLRANLPLSRDYNNIKYPGYYTNYTLKDADGLLFLGGRHNHKTTPIAGEGDSGGSGICRGENGYAVLCGAVSNGGDLRKCTKLPTSKYECRPDVYTEIQNYHDWIVKKAGDQSNAVVLKQPLYGEPVPAKKYQHQVHIVTKIGKKQRKFCGGTLIEKDIIATAAHCVADDNGNPHENISVTIGVRNVHKMSLGKKYDVVGVKILDGFRKSENSQKFKRVAMFNTLATPRYSYYKNDLALLKLKKEVDIASNKLPKIGKAKKSTSDNFVWHAEVSLPLNTTKAGGGVLQQRKFKLLQNDECQKRMSRVSRTSYGIEVDDNIMCGQEKYNGGSQCDRELGGGLMCAGTSGGEEVLCGIQVFRYCQLALPNVFLDVSSHKKWIEKTKTNFKKK